MSYNAPQSGQTPSSSSPSPSAPNASPLQPFEKYIVAHAVFCSVGFLALLPTGAIVARIMRTFKPLWFKLHWIIQWVLAFPMILIGFSLGITAVHKSGGPHLNDTHMKWGVALFVLYLFQISLGGFIHFYKIPFALIHCRSIQNYFHAVFGIFIIAAAFYQVRTGIRVEWPLYTGRGVSMGASAFWVVWLVLVLLGYCSGLILLRRQYRQEREARNAQLGLRMGFTKLNPISSDQAQYP